MVIDMKSLRDCALASLSAYKTFRDAEESGLSFANFIQAVMRPAPVEWIIPHESGTTQWLIIKLPDKYIVSFRGTTREDILTDLKVIRQRTLHGTVHLGFWRHAKAASELVCAYFATVDDDLPIITTGHSLGGAAAVLAGLAIQKEFPGRFCRTVTFGCPRIGDAEFSRYANRMTHHWRVVNANDAVTYLPSLLRGYRHSGLLVYLSVDGEVWVNPGVVSVFWDRWGWFKRGLFRWASDKKRDHYLAGYIEKILPAVE